VTNSFHSVKPHPQIEAAVLLSTSNRWHLSGLVKSARAIFSGVSAVIVAPFACKFWITAIDYLFQFFS
jgi:hypothetical protein